MPLPRLLLIELTSPVPTWYRLDTHRTSQGYEEPWSLVAVKETQARSNKEAAAKGIIASQGLLVGQICRVDYALRVSNQYKSPSYSFMFDTTWAI